MKQKTDVQQGMLALMLLSGDLLAYLVLLGLEQEGAIASEWGALQNSRRARPYRLTRAGCKLLEAQTGHWQQTAAIVGRFFQAKAEDFS